jgi:hypothetical protein
MLVLLKAFDAPVFVKLLLCPVRVIGVVQNELAQMLIPFEFYLDEFHGQFARL